MFDAVKTVVMGSNADFTHNCTKEECTIVEVFQKFYVGYPAKCLGKCFINAIYNDTHGKITVKSSYGTRVASFAIYDDIMYLSF